MNFTEQGQWLALAAPIELAGTMSQGETSASACATLYVRHRCMLCVATKHGASCTRYLLPVMWRHRDKQVQNSFMTLQWKYTSPISSCSPTFWRTTSPACTCKAQLSTASLASRMSVTIWAFRIPWIACCMRWSHGVGLTSSTTDPKCISCILLHWASTTSRKRPAS